MKKYLIKLNGKAYEVEMEEITGETSATLAKQAAAPAPVAEATATVAEAPAAIGSGEPVPAPMPGNILDVAVKVGDEVKNGQLLLVLEAMKMENEIVAPADGVVASVNVTKGTSVNAGDALISFQ